MKRLSLQAVGNKRSLSLALGLTFALAGVAFGPRGLSGQATGNERIREEEVLKTDLHQNRWPKLRARQQPVLQLVTELSSQVTREEATQRQLAAHIKRLAAELRTLGL